MSAYARKKGHDFERTVAQEFREIGFPDAMTCRKARGGDWSLTDNGIDLVNTGPFAVQCKRLANYVPVNTIEEIKPPFESIIIPEYPGVDRRELIGKARKLLQHIPLLLTKANGKPTMAILPWAELKKLIARAND